MRRVTKKKKPTKRTRTAKTKKVNKAKKTVKRRSGKAIKAKKRRPSRARKLRTVKRPKLVEPIHLGPKLDILRDPVCGKEVGHGNLTVHYNSGEFYFCSTVCRNVFAKSPDIYLHEEAA